MIREKHVKVFINPAYAEAQVREGLAMGDTHAAFLSSLGFSDFATISINDLDAFEFAPDGEAKVDHSVAAWMAWMRSWGVDADAELVRRVITVGWPKAGQGAGSWEHMYSRMGGGVGTRKRTSPFANIAIANAVMAALETSPSAKVRELVTAERARFG